jgi:hypothetical protein
MIVTIPSIGCSPLLPDLLDTLCDEPGVSSILLIDNAPRGRPAEALTLERGTSDVRMALNTGFISYIKVDPSNSIYWAWNQGIIEGTERREDIAILNDDLILPRGSLRFASKALSTGFTLMGLNYFNPQGPVGNLEIKEVHGTYRTGGFGGFAFVVAPGCPEVDPRFRWWYGDDDLAHRIKSQGGRLGIAMGAPVSHPTPSITGNQQPWLGKAIGEDTTLFRSLWPGVE